MGNKTAAIYPGIIGNQPIDLAVVPDTTQRHPTGLTVEAIDDYWGPGQFIYAKAAAAFKVGQCVYMDDVSGVLVATSMPNTAGQGFPAAFAVTKMAANTFGWFKTQGKLPALSGASVAANANIGITAAGTLGAVANGKQILNARVETAATGTVVKTCGLTNGSTTIKVPNTDGWFIGLALTGTGVGSSAVISSIDPQGNTIEASVASTSTTSSSVTATYNDGTDYWNVLVINRAFAQGQVV